MSLFQSESLIGQSATWFNVYCLCETFERGGLKRACACVNIDVSLEVWLWSVGGLYAHLTSIWNVA